MSAAILRLPSVAETPAPYNGKRRMDDEQPRRTISNEWRLDAPRRVWLAILSKWQGEYPYELACMSYRLDLDAGKVKSIRDYARIWKWTRRKVEYNFSGIQREVESWRTFQNVGDSNVTVTGQSRDNNPTDSAENAESRDSNVTVTGQSRDTYYTTPSPTPDNTPLNPPKGSKGKSAKVKKREEFEQAVARLQIPGNLDTPTFRDWWGKWLEHRYSRAKPKDWYEFFTDQLTMLSEYGADDAVYVVRKSTANGYTGLVDPPRKPVIQTNGQPQKSHYIDPD